MCLNCRKGIRLPGRQHDRDRDIDYLDARDTYDDLEARDFFKYVTKIKNLVSLVQVYWIPTLDLLAKSWKTSWKAQIARKFRNHRKPFHTPHSCPRMIIIPYTTIPGSKITW